MKNLITVAVLLGLAGTCWGLECYVCTAQTGNNDKCIKTTIQCRQEHDACRTQIMWRQPDFWQPRSNRYHFVSKTCDSKVRCEAEKASKGLKCMRDWWKDWNCVECCQGDRCNYFVTMGAGTSHVSFVILVAGFIVQYLFRIR